MAHPVLREYVPPVKQQACRLPAIQQRAMGIDERFERDSRRPLVVDQRVVEVEEDGAHG
jgi:hypothetical protein